MFTNVAATEIDVREGLNGGAAGEIPKLVDLFSIASIGRYCSGSSA